MIEPEDIALEESLKIFRARLDPVQREEFTDQIHIGAPREFHPIHAIRRFELGGENFGERLDPGPARVNQRAIYVEENQSDHRAGK